jgi:hypothetical protein
MARTTQSKDKTPEAASTMALKASRQNKSAAANPARKTASRPSGVGRVMNVPDPKRADRSRGNASIESDSTSELTKSAAAASSNPSFRTGSKGALIVDLLKREDGATIAMLTEATGWQKHSVRGFISATLKRDRGITIASQKDDLGNHRYKITTGT